ncbi:MAG: UDP-N-acetylmuramoyl-L-alanine--D-glutamate ligase [Pseudomonadota bacterium]|nr:UDP-N-acetylmuramoyl-L-alanine--D-glutamate ligase [Alphaproteobacteria bacterium]
MNKNTYVVLGYERSGKESEKHLLSLGHAVLVHDDHQNKIPDIKWEDVIGIVQSPGITPSHPISQAAKQHNIPIYTDIDLLQKRSPQAKYIGITGTNGKSTTTALIGHILKEAGLKTAVGGNIGVPALSLEQLDTNGWYVLELSSYQLELSHRLNLDVTVWTNISPDHLERHGTIENYVDAKKRMFDAAKWACLAIDDKYSTNINQQLHIPHVTIASETINPRADIHVDAEGTLHFKELTFDCTTLQNLKGRHNWQNVALAFAATNHILQDPKKVWQHIQTFPGLSHRQQRIAIINSVEFVNDSKATNADACEKALKTYLGKNIFWILGGVAKTDGIDSLSSYFPHIKKTYLIGEAQERFAETLKDLVPIEKCFTLEKAISHAYIDAKEEKNAVVLLSPACASFDQFRDYEHRGETFIELVKRIDS